MSRDEIWAVLNSYDRAFAAHRDQKRLRSQKEDFALSLQTAEEREIAWQWIKQQ